MQVQGVAGGGSAWSQQQSPSLDL